jgi:microsomal epoxide hydrolase
VILSTTAERHETMTAHTSTADSVLSRWTLLLNGVAMAALAAFSPVTAAAMRKGTTMEKKATTMQTATTQLETTQRAVADAIRPFHIHVSEEALTNLRRLAATRWPDRYEGFDRSLRLLYSPSCLCLSHRVHHIRI